MAQLIDIEKVTIDSQNLTAQVRLGEGLPLSTSQNIEATARVYWLMPKIAEHACFGDKGTTFQTVMGDTELAHLLEHVAVELIAQTLTTQPIACGKTRELEEPRTYQIELACPDDVLCSAALTSASDIVQWAFAEQDSKDTPDVKSIVDGINYMVEHAFELEKAQAEEAATKSLAEAPAATTSKMQPLTTHALDATQAKIDTEAPVATSAPAPAPAPAPQNDADDSKVLKFDASKIPGNRPL